MSVLKYKYLPFLMWLLSLSFFAYQFIFRLWPGLMIQQIMKQFAIDASQFGIVAAFYYYGYALAQIPLAIMLDRFGAKYIICFGAILCGLATIIFTYTNYFYLALLSRCLIGIGSAVGFLGVSKVISEWFPQAQYARMVGFSFSIGLTGAIYGGKPIGILIEAYSWQNVALVLAVISIIIGCLAYLILYSPNNLHYTEDSEKLEIKNFISLLSSRSIWMLALANLLMVGVLEGFADVWGVSYLMTAYKISKADAAGLTSLIYVGMLPGGPVLVWLSKHLGNYVVIAACGVGIAIAFTILLLMNTEYNWLLLASVFFATGMMCCYQVIVFATGADLVATQYLGVTIAFLNCVNMLGGSFFHTFIGKIMDIFWTGIFSDDGIRQYNLDTYKYALSIIPICAIIGAILICLVRMQRR